MNFIKKYASLSFVAALLAACGGDGVNSVEAPRRLDFRPPDNLNSLVPARTVLASAVPLASSGYSGFTGIHMTSNFSESSEEGIKGVVPGPFQDGGTISAASVQAFANVAPYVQPDGKKIVNEIVQVALHDVRLQKSNISLAGFWFIRDQNSGSIALQFRPSLDDNLKGVQGFAEDLTFMLQPDGSIQIPDSRKVSGVAKEFVAAVIENAPALLASAVIDKKSPAAVNVVDLVANSKKLSSAIKNSPDQYFNELRNLNAGWVGVSVAMFVDSVSDPHIRLKYRSTGVGSRQIATWEDADLKAFISRAKSQGFKIYLTLAFEEPDGDTSVKLPDGDPRCLSSNAPISRFLFGKPYLQKGEELAKCLSADYYWWNPAHPEYQTKKNIFWQDYADIAVKYARLAKESGVEMYSIGTETDWLFRARTAPKMPNHFGVELQSVVAQVRNAYNGILTYDQLMKVLMHPEQFDGGEWAEGLAEDLGFDVVGISAYLDTLSQHPGRVMTVSELESQFWRPAFDKVIMPLKSKYPGKPIVFTEYGVVNDVGAPFNQQFNAFSPVVNKGSDGISDGMLQQANIYASFFGINERYGRPVSGGFLWAHYIKSPQFSNYYCDLVTHEISCSPPAQKSIANGYASLSRNQIDVFYDFAEYKYPKIFEGVPEAGNYLDYFYRYYPKSNMYLAVRDGRVILHNNIDYRFSDVGAVNDYLAIAASSGFK